MPLEILIIIFVVSFSPIMAWLMCSKNIFAYIVAFIVHFFISTFVVISLARFTGTDIDKLSFGSGYNMEFRLIGISLFTIGTYIVGYAIRQQSYRINRDQPFTLFPKLSPDDDIDNDLTVLFIFGYVSNFVGIIVLLLSWLYLLTR